MLISIITSVYNCENYINDMLDSILEQTWQDWELILIDDASTDNTWSLISDYKDKRIKPFRNKENKGLTCNLNKAISLAKGKYLVRIDGDDIVYPHRLDTQVNYMEKHPDVILSGGWMRAFGNSDNICRSILDENVLKVNLLFNSVIYHPTFIMRKEVLVKNKVAYDEGLACAQDYDFIVQMSRLGKITNIPEVLVKYRKHDNQISQNKRKQQLECANITRKRLLKELNISLDEHAWDYWLQFCLLSYHTMEEQEYYELKKIINYIIAQNKVKKIYSEETLSNILVMRLNDYWEKCDKKKCYDKSVSTVNYMRLFQVICLWMKKKQLGKSIVEYLNKKKFNKVAIYGLSDVGEILLDELEAGNVSVMYALDRDPNIICSRKKIKVFHPQEKIEKVDAIIVTAIGYFEEIECFMRVRVDCPILSLENIIFDL